jgi:hypothetical protein
MNHFPHLRALLNDFENQTKKHDIDHVNRLLSEMVDSGMIEPIDDPNIQTDFYDWADVVGVLDQVEPDSRFA